MLSSLVSTHLRDRIFIVTFFRRCLPELILEALLVHHQYHNNMNNIITGALDLHVESGDVTVTSHPSLASRISIACIAPLLCLR